MAAISLKSCVLRALLCVLSCAAVAALALILAVHARRGELKASDLVDHEEHEEFLGGRNCSHRIRPVEMTIKGFSWERSLLVTQVEIDERGGDPVMQIEEERKVSTTVELDEDRIRRKGLTPSFEVDGKPVVIGREEKVEEKIRWSLTPRELVAEKKVLFRVSASGRDRRPRWPDEPPRPEGTGLESEEKYRVDLEGEGGETGIELPAEEWILLEKGGAIEVLKDGCGGEWGPAVPVASSEEEGFTTDPGTIHPGGGEMPGLDRPAAFAGRRVAVGSEKGTVLVLGRGGGEDLVFEQAVRCGDFDVWQVALSKRGDVLVAADDSHLCAWRLPEGRGRAELLWRWSGPPGSKHDFYWRWSLPLGWVPLEVSPDGRWLARAVPAGVALIDIEEGRVARFLERELESGPVSFAFHPAEPLLATGWTDGRVILWNIESGERLGTHDLWGALFRAGRYRTWLSNAGHGTLRKSATMSAVAWDEEKGLVATVDGAAVFLER